MFGLITKCSVVTLVIRKMSETCQMLRANLLILIKQHSVLPSSHHVICLFWAKGSGISGFMLFYCTWNSDSWNDLFPPQAPDIEITNSRGELAPDFRQGIGILHQDKATIYKAGERRSSDVGIHSQDGFVKLF